jgi:hypothetical protein
MDKEGDRSKNASATSGATNDKKQIGVVRKKKEKSKEDDSEEDALRKLKGGSSLSGASKVQNLANIDLSSYVTFKQFEEERSKMAKDLDDMKVLTERLTV